MRLSSLEIRGFKGSDRVVTFDRLNLFLGAVGSGKSAVEQAVQFAFLGCVPSLGRSAQSTARLMRGEEIFVRAELSDGRSFVRALRRETRKSAVTYRSIASCSWLPEGSSLSEADAAIATLVGENETDAAEHLDLRMLFACSPNERVARMTSMLDAGAMGPDVLVPRSTQLLRSRLTAQAQAEPHDVGDGDFGLVRPQVRERVPYVLAALHGHLRDSGIGVACERMQEAKLASAADQREKTAARGIIEARLVELRAPADALSDLRGRRDSAVQSGAAARRDVEAHDRAFTIRRQTEDALASLRAIETEATGRLQAALGALPRAQAARDEAAAIVDPAEIAAPLAVAADPEHLRQADELEARASAIADPETFPAPVPVGASEDVLAHARRLMVEAARKDEDAGLIEMPEALTTTDAEQAVTRAEDAVSLAGRSPWREVDRIADQLVDAYVPMCADDDHEPSCAGRAATALHALAVTHGGDTYALAATLASARSALEARVGECTIREEERVHARERIDALRAEAVALRAQAEEARRTAEEAAREANATADAIYRGKVAERQAVVLARSKERADLRAAAHALRTTANAAAAAENARRRDAHLDAASARAVQVDANHQARARLEREAATIQRTASECQTASDRAAADVRAAEAKLAGIATVAVDVAAAQERIAAAEALIRELDAKIAVVEGADGLRTQMRQLAREVEAAEAFQAAYAAAEWTCQALRREDIEARSKGLEARVREFLVGAGRAEEPYIRAGKGQLDFGWRRGDKEIAVEALSGGESVIFTAGLAAAIVSLRGPQVKALLIEAAELGSADPAMQVLRGCEAIARHLDFVCVATNAPITAGDGWSVQHMDQASALEALEGRAA